MCKTEWFNVEENKQGYSCSTQNVPFSELGPSLQYMRYIRSSYYLCTSWTILLNLPKDASLVHPPPLFSIETSHPVSWCHQFSESMCVDKFRSAVRGVLYLMRTSFWIALVLCHFQFSDLGLVPIILCMQK